MLYPRYLAYVEAALRDISEEPGPRKDELSGGLPRPLKPVDAVRLHFEDWSLPAARVSTSYSGVEVKVCGVGQPGPYGTSQPCGTLLSAVIPPWTPSRLITSAKLHDAAMYATHLINGLVDLRALRSLRMCGLRLLLNDTPFESSSWKSVWYALKSLSVLSSLEVEDCAGYDRLDKPWHPSLDYQRAEEEALDDLQTAVRLHAVASAG
jgi:hypothetical protein